MNFKKPIIQFLVLFVAMMLQEVQVSGQILGKETMGFKHLEYHDRLPKYLLSKKSLVLIDAPMSKEDPRMRSDWKALARTVHLYFRKMNIDAIAYYHIDDIFAGIDVNQRFAALLTKREFKYVIWVKEEHLGGSTLQYSITVTPFDNENTIVSQNQNAWKVEGTDLKQVLIDMAKDVLEADMKILNYLIPEDPEFFETTNIIKGRRIPTYATDLKVETLVVPRFQKFVIEDSTKVDASYLARIRSFNENIDRKNQRLEQIMETYKPLKYQLSDTYDSKALYNEGHQFMLSYMQSTGHSIKEMLGYKMEANETDYITLKAGGGGSTVYPLPAEAAVTKYFVKHVFTNDVYIGLNWDADLTWEESLQNFIFHMKDILKVN